MEHRKSLPTISRKAASQIWGILGPRRKLLFSALLLIVVSRVASLVIPYSTKLLIDNVIVKKEAQMLYRIVGLVLVATGLQAIANYTLQRTMTKASWLLITDLRVQVQRHISRLPINYYDANRTGNLVSRIMSDVEGVKHLVGTGLVEFLGGVLTAILAFVLLLRIDAKVTLVAVGFMGAFSLVQRKVFRSTHSYARDRGAITAEVTGRLTESLSGVRVVKSYRAEARESEVFAAGVQRLLDNVLNVINKTSISTAASTIVIGVVAALIMFLGAKEILSGHLTLGNYVTMTMLLALMMAPLATVVQLGTLIAEAVAGLERTHEVLTELREDDDPRRTISLEKEEIGGYIRFEDVIFSYEQDKPVLHGISFEARPNTVTALVGSSGSGKSTIIGMVCAFYHPDQGRILLDGIDLSNIQLDSYRSSLGVVLQESFLFSGSIRENIGFSRPGARPEDVVEAARIAGVTEFTDRFPEGLDTIVGERGVKLSGGQRQRVSIARAILSDPRILILDEATSSLDSESEAIIQKGLSYLIQGRTTLVIAHRLSTIRNADQILVVEGGRLVERGTHSELYRLRGRYYELYTRQHALESNLFLAPGEGDEDEPAEIASSEWDQEAAEGPLERMLPSRE